MKDEIAKLLDQYSLWLKDRTVLKEINHKSVEITTPYLDRHNDYLQVYVQKEGNHFLLTDDAYILTDLENSGCKIDTPRREELLRITLSGFGIQLEGKRMVTHASADNFSRKKHSIIQAMLAINDLFYLASPYVSSFFYEDVTKWLDLSEIRYTPKVKFSGKTGYDHMFDIVVPKSKKAPERILQTINNPKKDTAEVLLYKWLDTKDARPEDSKLYAFLNDANYRISEGVIDALQNYEAKPVLWSAREDVRGELAA